jgi:hypothetical protein
MTAILNQPNAPKGETSTCGWWNKPSSDDSLWEVRGTAPLFGKSMRGDRGGSWSMRRMIERIFDVMEFSFMERIGSGRLIDEQATGLEQI